MDHGDHGTMADLPPFSFARGMEFGGDPLFLWGSLAVLALYLWGAIRLHRRGDRWPVGRTVSFALGIVSIIAVTCTALNDYGMVLFSVHMVQHMVISMVTPLLLLLGARSPS